MEAYVLFCLYVNNTTEKRKGVELLESLPISDKPWKSISIDFISGFRKSKT